MKRSGSRAVPNWVESWRDATASNVALICAVDMLGSMTWTFGPKSGSAVARWDDAAAPPIRARGRRSAGARLRRGPLRGGDEKPCEPLPEVEGAGRRRA